VRKRLVPRPRSDKSTGITSGARRREYTPRLAGQLLGLAAGPGAPGHGCAAAEIQELHLKQRFYGNDGSRGSIAPLSTCGSNDDGATDDSVPKLLNIFPSRLLMVWDFRCSMNDPRDLWFP